MSKIVEATSSKDITESEKPVLVDFYATWCAPCRQIAPILEEFAEENDDIKVVKVNVEQHQELGSQYKVSGIPKIIVLDKQGDTVAESLGVVSKSKLEEMASKATK